MKGREELASLREMHAQMVQENENRIRGMQQSNQTKDNERRENEFTLLKLEEYRKSLEVKYGEAQKRLEFEKSIERQMQNDEAIRSQHINDMKRKLEEEKRILELELTRLQEDLKSEKALRADAEARESSLRNDFQRLSEHRNFLSETSSQKTGTTTIISS
mmetsp:Transcript_29941/g.95936  ORF Transcript_29941/g.95936 Transcript_29941/m.95936 type:complete len:161 (+) Transcript_29941:613-1095(+)